MSMFLRGKVYLIENEDGDINCKLSRNEKSWFVIDPIRFLELVNVECNHAFGCEVVLVDLMLGSKRDVRSC